MTEKVRMTFDWTWHVLQKENERAGTFVTAGQVAKAMGISRNTAKKYLDAMYDAKAIRKYATEGKNKQVHVGYFAIPQDTL